MILGIIHVLLVGLILAPLASWKGYSSACWFFAWGLIGLAVLAFLPSVEAANSDELTKAQIRWGNKVGFLLSVTVGLVVALQIISVVLTGHEFRLFV